MMAAMFPVRSRLAAAAAACTMAACAGYAPGPELRVGADAQEATRAMGPPTGRYALPGGGTRLEYARGPFGKHTYMVDTDAQGRVLGWQQVLDEAHFNAIAPGITADELRLRLGRPSNVRGGGWQGGEVWSYRYDAIFCQWWQASVIDGRVRDVAYAPDPLCEVNDREELLSVHGARRPR